MTTPFEVYSRSNTASTICAECGVSPRPLTSRNTEDPTSNAVKKMWDNFMIPRNLIRGQFVIIGNSLKHMVLVGLPSFGNLSNVRRREFGNGIGFSVVW